MKKVFILFLLFNCSSNKGFLINNYQPKDKRIGKTILVNQENSINAYAQTVQYSIKQNLDQMEKCVEDSNEPVSFSLNFSVNTAGKVIDNSVENLRDKEQRKCLNNILSTIVFQQPHYSGTVHVYQPITLNRN